MADRIPLIVKGAPTNQIQELPNQDDLVLSGQLKMTGTASGGSDILLSGGTDGHSVLTVTGHNSNVSKLTIDGRGNAGGSGSGGASNIAEFIVTNTTVEFKCKGDITAFASSDATLKENITPISNAVDKVLSISGNTFTWNEKSIYNGEEGTGIIAQEIEALGLPGLTTTRENGTKAVRYDRLVPLLIEAIKELSNKVKSLEK